MTLGNIFIIPGGEVKESLVVSEVANTALDGSTYGYYYGAHKEWVIPVRLVDIETKKKIEALKNSKFRLTLDNGYTCWARIVGNIAWTEHWVQDRWAYSTNLKVVEVVE
mgnify:CR=1 FL=1